ncbi:unnamed protein product [Timema podura]|uniref:Uncharacterized protein n=1 Tax=Timema podura TaxID=61482 RepID=A0ABN7PNK3_TIMPD|nr:unnamed protein product [Timema podura]
MYIRGGEVFCQRDQAFRQ